MLDWLFGRKKEPTEPQATAKPTPPARKQSQKRWMYEFVVQFLCSPIWRVSILDFTDHHCVIFDNEEENKFQYTRIHKQFKELVASLFDSMTAEIGITNQDLAEIIETGLESKNSKLFNQIFLCDDFMQFKALMVKRNKKLEQEAIEALKSGKEPSNKQTRERDAILETQRFEETRKARAIQQEEQALKMAIQMSLRQSQTRDSIDRLQKLAEVATEPVQSISIQNLPEISPVAESPPPKATLVTTENVEDRKSLPTLGQLKRPRRKLPQREQGFQPEQKKPVASIEELPKEEVKPVEQQPVPSNAVKRETAQERRRRLIEQRDAIRKHKEKERQAELVESFATGAQNPQNIVLQDDGIRETQKEIQNSDEPKLSAQEIERRRNLMKKIHKRLVDEF